MMKELGRLRASGKVDAPRLTAQRGLLIGPAESGDGLPVL